MKLKGDYILNGSVWTWDNYWADFWRYRHLTAHLASSSMRDKVRGAGGDLLWIIAHPLILSGIFAVVFGNVFGGGNIAQFIVYVLSGIVVFEYFAGLLGGSLNVLTNAQPFLKQARTPIVVYLLQHSIFQSVLFCYGILGLIAVAAISGGVKFGLSWAVLPVVFALIAITFAPLAIIGGLVGYKKKGLRPFITYFVMVLYYLTPVFIARDLFDSSALKLFTFLNPISQSLDLVRMPLIYGKLPDLVSFSVVGIWAIILWSSALLYLSTSERIRFSAR